MCDVCGELRRKMMDDLFNARLLDALGTATTGVAVMAGLKSKESVNGEDRPKHDEPPGS